MTSILSIFGASGHGRVIADSAVESGDWQIIEFYDDKWPEREHNGEWPVVGRLQSFIDQRQTGIRHVIVGIGDNTLRHTLQMKLSAAGYSMATIVHPNATVSRSCTIEPGVVLMAGAVVNTGAVIGAGSIINTNASIDHDCRLGLAVHISPGATVAGAVTIGDRSWMGAGSVVVNNTRIGNDVIVGAGSTVIRDIQDNHVVAGSPARTISNRVPVTD